MDPDSTLFDSFYQFLSKERKSQSTSFVQVGEGAYKVSEETPNPNQQTVKEAGDVPPFSIQYFNLMPMFESVDRYQPIRSENLQMLIMDISRAIETMNIQKMADKYVFDFSSLPLRIEFDRIQSQTVIHIKVFDSELFREFMDNRALLIQSIKDEMDLFDIDVKVEYSESRNNNDPQGQSDDNENNNSETEDNAADD